MYVDWIYFSEIASKVIGSQICPLIQLYLFGDEVDDKDLRNRTMGALHANGCETQMAPSPPMICHIWKNTSEGSMLRKWVFDHVLLKTGPLFADIVSELPPEFVQQIAAKLMQQAPVMNDADFLAKSQEYQEAENEA
jgi:hypothetical protein